MRREMMKRASVLLLAPVLTGSVLWVGGVGSKARDAAKSDGQEVQVRVMTFNIRYGTADDGENAWPTRREQVAAVITEFRPTVLGVQEALSFQLEELDRALAGYARVGVGRDDGVKAGEFSAIYYDATGLEVLESGTFWFSEWPTRPGSTAWGATIPRICTWARFRDRTSDRSFYAYNNHWDHQAQESREKSAALLLSRIGERSAGTDPVIVTGDFNSGEDNAAFEKLVSDGAVPLRDTYRELHRETAGTGTFNGFEGATDGPKIDAILVTPQWSVESASIDRTNRNGKYPSDHFPVTAVIRLGGR